MAPCEEILPTCNLSLPTAGRFSFSLSSFPFICYFGLHLPRWWGSTDEGLPSWAPAPHAMMAAALPHIYVCGPPTPHSFVLHLHVQLCIVVSFVYLHVYNMYLLKVKNASVGACVINSRTTTSTAPAPEGNHWRTKTIESPPAQSRAATNAPLPEQRRPLWPGSSALSVVTPSHSGATGRASNAHAP